MNAHARLRCTLTARLTAPSKPNQLSWHFTNYHFYSPPAATPVIPAHRNGMHIHFNQQQ